MLQLEYMILAILVKPGQKAEAVYKRLRSVVVCVKSQAEANKANASVIKVLARETGLNRNKIHIKQGNTTRRKLVELFDTDERVMQWLAGLPEA